MQFLNRLAHNSPDVYFDDGTLDSSIEDTSPADNDTAGDAVPKGTCIVCLDKICDIILVPCFHIVICSTCWASAKENHIQQCEILFAKNKRKQALEKKKIKCPACEHIVQQSNTFHMATFN